jgi:acyl-coenzyme A synthetase/AMP-(fatty) acid ligase
VYQTDQLITFWAEIKSQELAFVDEEHEVTFAQLDSFTRRIAFKLNERGIKQGDLVAIILPSYLGWLCTLSLYRLGVSTLSQNNLNPFNEQVSPDWVISLEPHPGTSNEKSILIDDAYLEEVNTAKEMQNLPGFNSPDDIATLFATSGTTGDVKYIAPTAEELRVISNRPGTNDSFGEDGVLSRFMFGAAWAHFHALKCLNLGKAYYSCIFSDYRLPKFVSQYPIRTLIGSPAQISSFLDIQEQTGTKLPLLKTILMGGSVPSSKIIDRIKSQIDCKLFNTYGSTEAGHIAIYEIGTAEQPAFSIRPPVTLEIVDENDIALPKGEVGIVRYKRPDMSHSYYKNPSATAKFFRDGYFYPGDSGYLDTNGHLVLDGRVNEVINLGGAKLNPEIIDRIAISQLGVVDCAAFAVHGLADIDQLGLALVVDGDFSAEIFENTMTKKSPFPIVAVVVTDKIARNENGKVLRSILTQQYLDSTKS